MKRNITIITIALKVLLIALALYIAVYALAMLAQFIVNGSDVSRALLDDVFTPLKPAAPGVEAAFMLLYSVLLVFLFTRLNNFRLTLKSLKTAEVFETNQAESFRKTGSGIIIFAKLKYLLICGFGSIGMLDIRTFFNQALPYLALYITGKFILILAEMLKRGEMLREETELTI
ncbi:hypothetical protein [Flavobacterium psychrotrophum]|uniref:hypothetical protein n=1 Tax=Flavobacterium psychrotrophum TaxID=2294119 RepID=UPI000E323C1F|nr:hypothetical protein [Flavobacterium psychrotrophum]